MACTKRERDGYADIAQSYNKLHREEQERKIKLIIQNYSFSDQEKLLDVGCGTGFSLSIWPVKEAWGVEPSAAMIAQAPLSLKPRIFHLRAEDMSIFEDEEFDIVVSVTAIHNFTGIEDGLLEMKRVGKEKFIFSILKKSAKLSEIEGLIRKHFLIENIIDEDQHDKIYICKK